MADLNEVNFVGSLAEDPEVRQLGDGRSVCNLRISTTNTWRDRSTGEQKSRSSYHSVVIYNNELVPLAQRLKTGSRVTLRGELQTRKWEDSGGNTRYTTEVVIQGLEGKFFPHLTVSAPQPTEQNRRSVPQRGQISGTPPRNVAEKQLQSAPAWDFEFDDEIPDFK